MEKINLYPIYILKFNSTVLHESQTAAAEGIKNIALKFVRMIIDSRLLDIK